MNSAMILWRGRLLVALTAAMALWPASPVLGDSPPAASEAFDVVVYGGTPGGIAAAVAAAREGRTVALVEYHDHVGGMATSGLGKSDVENRAMIGGMFVKFTERVRLTSFGDYYPNMAHWGQFRLRVRAAGEFLIVPEYGLVLRAGIQERYDSAPGTGLPNDIDYFTTVLMKF